MNLKYLEEISLINRLYSNDYHYNNYYHRPPEKFTYIYEFSDGRFAICSSFGNIKICKFKLS